MAGASVAIDGSKFKAVNTRDKNFTKGKAFEKATSHRQPARNIIIGKHLIKKWGTNNG
jgi:hypothetical protein|tara:strand:- start:536 stop:709 length:174 start_codon:yes stop_codon:yes gene_type:complete